MFLFIQVIKDFIDLGGGLFAFEINCTHMLRRVVVFNIVIGKRADENPAFVTG